MLHTKGRWRKTRIERESILSIRQYVAIIEAAWAFYCKRDARVQSSYHRWVFYCFMWYYYGVYRIFCLFCCYIRYLHVITQLYCAYLLIYLEIQEILKSSFRTTNMHISKTWITLNIGYFISHKRFSWLFLNYFYDFIAFGFSCFAGNAYIVNLRNVSDFDLRNFQNNIKYTGGQPLYP